MTLCEALEIKRSIEAMKKELEVLKAEHGVDQLEKDIENKEAVLKFILKNHVDNGEIEDGTIRIVNMGRSHRVVRVCNVMKDKDLWELLIDSAVIPVKEFEKVTKNYPDTDKFYDTITATKYDIVDLM